jgi:hypothetical protein
MDVECFLLVALADADLKETLVTKRGVYVSARSHSGSQAYLGTCFSVLRKFLRGAGLGGVAAGCTGSTTLGAVVADWNICAQW